MYGNFDRVFLDKTRVKLFLYYHRCVICSNKCHNEKRRRELENETINQLEELLGTCLAEVKQPDKNGIVREATRQIQEVLKRRRECPDDCPVRALGLSPLQAGEITSTQPQAASTSLHYSELTTLIEVGNLSLFGHSYLLLTYIFKAYDHIPRNEIGLNRGILNTPTTAPRR